MVTDIVGGFIQSLKLSENRRVQHRKHYQRKAMLDNFHLNGHTLGVHQKLGNGNTQGFIAES